MRHLKIPHKSKLGNTISREVHSNQQGVHHNLEALVAKHLQQPFAKPIAPRSYEIFEELLTRQPPKHRGIILDSGCGTGHSTVNLAKSYPEFWVIGIDKSADRLSRKPDSPPNDNCVIVRADCVDIWRIMREQHMLLAKHLLLYPNPWPKAKHLKRRWHGHPAFQDLCALGGTIELRTNWPIYASEFGLALETAKFHGVNVAAYLPTTDISLFEKKYRQSGHRIFRVTANPPTA